MNIRQSLKIKWIILRRNYIFWGLCLVNYIFLALGDTKTILFFDNYEQAIYRYVVQQLFIVISSGFLLQPIFNEKTLYAMKNYLLIYNKNIKTEIYSIFCVDSLVNIGAFLIGQVILLGINIVKAPQVYIQLWGVNLIIVTMEILISLLLIMGLRLLLKKDILVFCVFFIIVIFSIASNNILLGIPLTMNMVGISSQGYYVTFGKELWIGRIILFLVAFFIFKLGIKYFKYSWKREK